MTIYEAGRPETRLPALRMRREELDARLTEVKRRAHLRHTCAPLSDDVGQFELQYKEWESTAWRTASEVVAEARRIAEAEKARRMREIDEHAAWTVRYAEKKAAAYIEDAKARAEQILQEASWAAQRLVEETSRSANRRASQIHRQTLSRDQGIADYRAQVESRCSQMIVDARVMADKLVSDAIDDVKKLLKEAEDRRDAILDEVQGEVSRMHHGRFTVDPGGTVSTANGDHQRTNHVTHVTRYSAVWAQPAARVSIAARPHDGGSDDLVGPTGRHRMTESLGRGESGQAPSHLRNLPAHHTEPRSPLPEDPYRVLVRYRAEIFRRIYSRVGNEERANDLTQRTLTWAGQHWRGVDGAEGKLLGWLRQIADYMVGHHEPSAIGQARTG